LRRKNTTFIPILFILGIILLSPLVFSLGFRRQGQVGGRVSKNKGKGKFILKQTTAGHDVFLIFAPLKK
jgi:hypothetical protein